MLPDSGKKVEEFAVLSGGLMVLEGNDRDVLDGCRRGEPDAFRELFERHKDKVYSIALRFTGDASAAMDITQDVFLKLLSGIGDFRGDAAFESWLYRMVVNRCIDQHRRARRWIPVVVEEMVDLVRTTGHTVLHELLRVEFETSVQDVVARLAPEQRMVVVLRYTEGLAYEEIAALMGCSVGTVASRLNRAHKVLERRLAHLRENAGGGK